MPLLPPQLPFRGNRATLLWPTGGGQPYEVPDDAQAVLIVAVGGGGGGGNGFTAAAAAARGGGGGGGTGGVTRIIVPAVALPRVLFVNPGIGGAPNTAGGLSFVSVAPASANATNICTATGGNGGGNGTGTGGGALGTAGGLQGITQMLLSWMALHEFSAGVAGVAGGAHTGVIGASVNWAGAIGISGGAGGGGTTSADFGGGSINGSGLVPTIAGGAAGSNDGRPGYWRQDLLLSTGGSGGGSSNAGVGGRGGDGGPGSGGGGGGGGTTGGAGGRGGNGFVLILAL